MYCPNCGQERNSQETRFCSRCGFLLTGAAELLRTGGVIPGSVPSAQDKVLSPRTRGLKQGLFIFLLTFLAVPIIAMITVFLRLPPFGVGIAAVFFTIGGLLRMVYALMFESANPGLPTLEETAIASAKASMHQNANVKSLPQGQSIPASSYIAPATGNWRDTNELQPTSVTESTTQLLNRDDR